MADVNQLERLLKSALIAREVVQALKFNAERYFAMPMDKQQTELENLNEANEDLLAGALECDMILQNDKKILEDALNDWRLTYEQLKTLHEIYKIVS